MVTQLQAAQPAVAGRYALGRELGVGGYGTVYEATDTLTGARVALKRFHATDPSEAIRVRREIAALRLLRHVGVVRLLDDGEHESGLFLVMELVSGEPFPGRPKPCAWEDIAETTSALFGILAEVHDAGVVHRDLKPSNILVDARGVPTLLDFGLARGERLGPAITLSGTAVGTPQYLAPEQAFGQPTDARADLWALGALIYEALTGAMPHAEDDSDVAGLLVRRATQPARPIRALRPDVPEGVAAAVDALLAVRADDRPASARDALRMLGQEAPVAASPLPELRPAAVARAIDVVLRERHALDIDGPHGAGHTHLLDVLARAAPEHGLEPVRAVPARTPFASLAPLVGLLDGRPRAGIDEMVEHCRAAALAALQADRVLIVDDLALVDPWSQRILASLGPDLPVARSLAGRRPEGQAGDPGRARLTLGSLTPAELQPIFTGADRILHLREDAARELHRRSRGLPRAAANEVARWLRLGLADRDDGRVRLTRTNIERLTSDSHTAVQLQAGGRPERARGRGSVELSSAVRRALHLRDVARVILLAGTAATREVVTRAWGDSRWRLEAALGELEALGVVVNQPDGTLTLDGVVADHLDLDPAARRLAHGRIADALEAHDPRRIAHLVAADRIGEVAAAAVAAAGHLEREGRQERALAIVIDALAIARVAGDAVAAARLATRLVLIALADGSDTALQRAQYELQPRRTTGIPAERIEPLRQVVEAGLRGSRLGARDGLPLLDDVSAFDDTELATWVWTLRVRAARAAPVERERAVVAEACTWARAVAAPATLARQLTWAGRLAYREGNWERAADLQERAARERALPFVLRLSARTNAASALMEAGRFDDAVRIAGETAAAAAACRHAYFELRAVWMERTAAFRRGDTLAPDPELASVAVEVGVPYMEVLSHMTEAAIRWRRGEAGAMAMHARAAREGATLLRMEVVEGLARMLGWVALGEVPEGAVRPMFDAVRGWQEPGLRLQGIAFLVVAAGSVEPDWAVVADAAWQAIAPAARDHRLEVMSAAESRAVVDAVWRREPDAVPLFVRSLRAAGGGA